MATIAQPETSPLQKERAFFFYMALAVLATVLAGFSSFYAIGGSSFDSPWWVHLHAASMGTWVLLFVAQNSLVFRGQVAMHRKLGVLAAVWSVWIVVLGFSVTAMDVRTHRVPPFFTPNYFLVMDWLNMLAFAALAWSGIRLRNRSDWHKRLMLGAMIQLIAVAWGRMTFPYILDQRANWLVMVILLGYFAVGMAFDRRTRGRIHPAYFWGAGALVAYISLSSLLADLPPVLVLTAKLGG